jgi:hypothetical protein
MGYALIIIYKFGTFNMYQLFKPHYSTPVNKYSSKQNLLNLKIMVNYSYNDSFN